MQTTPHQRRTSMLLPLSLFAFLGLAISLPLFAQDGANPADQSILPPAQAPASADPQTSPPLRGPDVYRVGKDVKPPKVIYDPDPAYPEVAAKAGYDGTVVLWLVIKTDGTPDNIKVQRSIGMGLDEAAFESVRMWRFRPATLNGQPVPVMINVEINFSPDARVKSLSAPPGARGEQSQFSGIDLSKYPMVVRIGASQGVSEGNTFAIESSATLTEAGTASKLSLACQGKSSNCFFLDAGEYPARWLSRNQRLEIVGRDWKGKSARRGEYSVK